MLISLVRASLVLMMAFVTLSSCTFASSPGEMTSSITPKPFSLVDSDSPSYKVTDGLLFVATSTQKQPYSAVQVYNTRAKGQPMIASLTNDIDDPQSACIDQHRTLYVINV